MSRIEWLVTSRGFNFSDRYQHTASIQTSSLATEDCIWLGLNEGVHVDGQCCARMHVDQELAAELWPLLKRFAETGELTDG